MFSGTKKIADERWAHLGSEVYEELTMMGCAWGPGLYDAATWNAMQVEEVNLLEFEGMLVNDADTVEWDKFNDDAGWGDSFELEV